MGIYFRKSKFVSEICEIKYLAKLRGFQYLITKVSHSAMSALDVWFDGYSDNIW